MSAKAILSSLPYKIKLDLENETYHKYMARCARILTENTAAMVQGSYINVEYDDIINPKPQTKYEQGEIANKIKSKLR